VPGTKDEANAGAGGQSGAVADGGDSGAGGRENDAAIGGDDSGDPVDAGTAPESGACRLLVERKYVTCLLDTWSDDDAGVEATLGDGQEAELTGTVEGTVSNATCSGIGGGLGTATGFGVEIGSEGRGITIGFALPMDLPLFSIGDVLHVKFQRDAFAGFENLPPKGSVVIRSEDGELLYWAAESYYGLRDLEVPPEIDISSGSSCSHEGGRAECDVVTRAGLLIDTGRGAVDVPYSEKRDVGSFAVLHGNNEKHANTGSDRCLNEHHHISVVAIRGSLESLNIR
jgi:hypothetical protein